MAEARRCDQWNHTAAMLAAMVNTAFGKKGKPVDAAKFHPFAKQFPKRRLTKEQSRQRLNQAFGINKHGRKRRRTQSRRSDD